MQNADVRSGYGPRIAAFEHWRDHVRTLPTVAEKFDATVPHERAWNEWEYEFARWAITAVR